ncbi:MAG: thiamine phosphate synthase [Verrucomicrobia bacterium]|nr:thiamine phosphate synthase [Verrucomicrobiota bacterium]
MNLAPRSLYGILDLSLISAADAPCILEQMLAGGVDLVQLRAKSHPLAEIAALAQPLQRFCTAAGVPFILNDHPQLAAELGLDGVHVGQDDLSVAETRRLLGPGRLVGKSTASFAEAVAAAAEAPDYLGFGPLFATPTKSEAAPIGLAEIRRVQEAVSLPVYCIGGIKRENLALVLAAGARHIVIISGILKAPDITAYCREVKALLQAAE